MFWIYVELFHLLFYKYRHGLGTAADGRRAAAADELWRLVPVVAFVRIRTGAKRPHQQRPATFFTRSVKIIDN